MSVLDRIAAMDRFFVQQKFTLVANRYRISSVAADGRSEAEPLLYVNQKRLKIREQVDVFADESKQELVLRLKSRKVFEFRGRSEVQLPDGTVIGQLQKVFGRSLFRSTWEVRDASGDNVIATAQESSMFMAALRRLWDFIPIAENVPFFLPFHFDIQIDGKTVGKHRRIPALVDRYVLDLSGDTERKIDRRVAVAFAIALDMLQDR